ncbi:hypothetical protein J6590_015865 [Homalodisca vitripennis]|nr:hypothetical protein J6590_015865 [Homalodisca vitripennis]
MLTISYKWSSTGGCEVAKLSTSQNSPGLTNFVEDRTGSYFTITRLMALYDKKIQEYTFALVGDKDAFMAA